MEGLSRDLNPGPPAPKAGIIPLDQLAAVNIQRLTCLIYFSLWNYLYKQNITFGSGGIRTHALERTGALNQRLRPLGHATDNFLDAFLTSLPAFFARVR